MIKRRDLVYGYFTSMYGIAGVFITTMLDFNDDLNIGAIFLGAMVISGVIEYLTSLFLEKSFGLRFWDYTRIKPNIQGRVNLWYLIVFGVLGSIWGKYYSLLLAFISKLHGNLFIIITCLMIAFFILNFIMTGVIFYRYKKRREGEAARCHFEKWLDLKYSNRNIKGIFPAAEVVGGIIE